MEVELLPVDFTYVHFDGIRVNGNFHRNLYASLEEISMEVELLPWKLHIISIFDLLPWLPWNFPWKLPCTSMEASANFHGSTSNSTNFDGNFHGRIYTSANFQ